MRFDWGKVFQALLLVVLSIWPRTQSELDRLTAGHPFLAMVHLSEPLHEGSLCSIASID